MDYDAIGALRDRHPAWRLLRAGNAVLILSFLGGFFVEGNRGACSASEVADALTIICTHSTPEVPRRGTRKIRAPIWTIGRPPMPGSCDGSTRPATTKSTMR